MIIADLPHHTTHQLFMLQTACLTLKSGFDSNQPIDNLVAQLEVVERIWEDLKDELPPASMFPHAERHLKFIRYYLDRDQIERCRKDVEDLAIKDVRGLIYAAEMNIRKAVYHPRVSSRVFPPLKRQEFDSAVRRAFAVLKSELVDRFDVSEDLDGERLFNACFGSNGAAISEMGETDCQAIRNYLSGLSVLYRNQFAHNDVDGEWTEAAAVVTGINAILLKLAANDDAED